MWYLVLYGIFALWVLQDGLSRKLAASAAGWTLGTLIMGPIVLPVYLAKRPLKKGEVREGGTAWNVLKNFAILWTVLMAIAAFSALMQMGQVTSTLDSDAAKAGAGIGILLGMGFLAAVWFLPTLGAAILGFFMKKNSIVETGPTGPLIGQQAAAGFANGWGSLAVCAIVGLIVAVTLPRTTAKATATGESTLTAHAGTTAGANTAHTWEMNEKSDPMDATKEFSLTLQSEDKVKGLFGSESAYLCVRCRKRKIEAYVSMSVPVEPEYGSDTYGVRTKFDDEAAVKYRWDASRDRKALFAPKPGELVKRLEDSSVFMFEFTPFQQGPTAIKFNVAGLREKLAPIADACSLSSE